MFKLFNGLYITIFPRLRELMKGKAYEVTQRKSKFTGKIKLIILGNYLQLRGPWYKDHTQASQLQRLILSIL